MKLTSMILALSCLIIYFVVHVHTQTFMRRYVHETPLHYVKDFRDMKVLGKFIALYRSTSEKEVRKKMKLILIEYFIGVLVLILSIALFFIL